MRDSRGHEVSRRHAQITDYSEVQVSFKLFISCTKEIQKAHNIMAVLLLRSQRDLANVLSWLRLGGEL